MNTLMRPLMRQDAARPGIDRKEYSPVYRPAKSVLVKCLYCEPSGLKAKRVQLADIRYSSVCTGPLAG
jgi:hypothetical protein